MKSKKPLESKLESYRNRVRRAEESAGKVRRELVAVRAGSLPFERSGGDYKYDCGKFSFLVKRAYVFDKHEGWDVLIDSEESRVYVGYCLSLKDAKFEIAGLIEDRKFCSEHGIPVGGL